MNSFLLNLIDFLIKIIPLIVASFIGFLFGTLKDSKNVIFNRKLAIYSQIVSKISKHEYLLPDFDRDELIDVFAPARLLGSKKLEFYLREYYALIVEYKNLEDETFKEKKSNEVSEAAMNIEQIMREELGTKRLLSKKEISKHIYD